MISNKFGPTCNGKFDYSRKVKQEHDTSSRGRCSSLVTPLYANISELGNGGPISRKKFAKCFHLCVEGLSPKQFKIPKDLIMEDIHKFFGPIQNKNGYNYVFNENPKVIAKVEGLWMSFHQKTGVPTSRIISLIMARRIMTELVKGKKMNWAMYAKWMNQE